MEKVKNNIVYIASAFISFLNILLLAFTTKEVRGLPYWFSKYELAISVALVLLSILLKKLNSTLVTVSKVALLNALVLSLANQVMLHPGSSPLSVFPALIGSVVLLLSKKLKIENLELPLIVLIVLSWVLYSSPSGAAATVLMTTLGMLSTGLVLNTIFNPSLRSRITSIFSLLSFGFSVVFTYAVGVNFERVRSFWFTFVFISLVFTIILALMPISKQSSLVKGFALVTVLLIGSTSLTFTTAEADITPKTKPVPVEETLTGNGMTGDKGAGPKDRYINVKFDQCDELNKRDCFITYFDQMAKVYGIDKALADVVGKVKNNQGYTFPKHCHQAVHNLGQAAMQITGQDFSKTILLDPQVCGTGYVHGLFEQSLTNLGYTKLFTSTNTVCSSLGMNNDFYRWTCSHILGHLLMASSMANPATAMEYCLNIERTTNQSDCLAGGWMNFFQDDQILDYVGSVGDVKKLFEVCYGAQTGKVKLFCYQELFPAIYRIVNGDDYAAGKACVDYSEAAATSEDAWTPYALNYLDRCGQGLARAVAVGSDYDYRRVPPRCLSMPAPVQNPCLSASAASIVTNTGSLDAGMKVCQFVTEIRYRNFCMFWVKDSRIILKQGPNSQNLPKDGEVRVPGLAPGVPSDKLVPPAPNVK